MASEPPPVIIKAVAQKDPLIKEELKKPGLLPPLKPTPSKLGAKSQFAVSPARTPMSQKFIKPMGKQLITPKKIPYGAKLAPLTLDKSKKQSGAAEDLMKQKKK